MPTVPEDIAPVFDVNTVYRQQLQHQVEQAEKTAAQFEKQAEEFRKQAKESEKQAMGQRQNIARLQQLLKQFSANK